MRVIAGEFRGRKLQSLPGKEIRPTSDKVKGALFNMIGPFFEGGRGLDLFAGTGSLGIEALSRGLGHVVFVDRHRQAVRLVQTNLHALGLEEKSEVYCMDAQAALARFAADGRQFDLVFLDPPYALGLAPLNWLYEAGGRGILAEDATVVLEHDARVAVPDQVGILEKLKSRRYGSSMLTIFRRSQPPKGRDGWQREETS